MIDCHAAVCHGNESRIIAQDLGLRVTELQRDGAGTDVRRERNPGRILIECELLPR